MNWLAYRWCRWRALALLTFGRQAAAQAVFNDMIARWPEDAYAVASRAHLRMQAGQLDEALADSRRLLAIRGDEGVHWFNHGFMLESAAAWEEALDAFTRATELSPELDRAWYGMALVLIRLQRHEEAVVALERNIELQPMSPFGWYQLARVQLDRRQPDAVVKIIRHLQGFEPQVAAQLERETGLRATGQAA